MILSRTRTRPWPSRVSTDLRDRVAQELENYTGDSSASPSRALRSTQSPGPGGVGCSEDRRIMQDDQARAQDTAQHHADHAGHAYAQPEGRQHAAPLVEELRDQVGYLREQLRREQDAHAEARRIIAALTARIPAHEAPSEPREAP